MNCLAAIMPPKVIDAPDPRDYGRVTNTTTLFRVTVGTNGTVTDVKLIRSGGQKFDDSGETSCRSVEIPASFVWG